MNFFEKVQKLSETKRKIILWSAVIIIGLILFIFWVENAQLKLKSFRGENFFKSLNIPFFGESFPEIPQLEIPEEQLNQENNDQ